MKLASVKSVLLINLEPLSDVKSHTKVS